MWSIDTDNNGNNTYNYTQKDHPDFVEFTIDEVDHAGHDAGTAGTHCRTRKYYGLGIHVGDWFGLFRREMDRARQGLEPTRYMAVRAREHYWVEPTLCNPVIDSSQYTASQKANQKRMVA